MNDQKIALTLPWLTPYFSILGTRPYQETAQLIQAIQEQAIPQMPMPAAAQPEAASAE
jgi:hypothetical protein